MNVRYMIAVAMILMLSGCGPDLGNLMSPN